ncbi:unnamed protein product [Mycena citricolor]|uniref:Major facilitator superfamily (MFS) profile domain-containing protein n=1 Tax=Mycena citricolor TaxID=2018698 RepID=A0AAD2HEE4_9AGAR|nr:unnamed protein product [Mycena citricolor]CAK5272612.1 unnamed protein product [Mycena citricolor]
MSSVASESLASAERQGALTPQTEKEQSELAEKSLGMQSTIPATSTTSPEPGEDEMDYPSGLRLWLLTIALFLSVFLVALDNTVIATAIPKITDQFNSLNDVGWYGSAYMLTTAATQLLFGKLYTFMPVKWVFVSAIVVFEIGSAICGAAPNSISLIIGRAIAGLGSAGIFSGAMIIIANTVPLRKRPIYSGIIGATFGIANVAGPLMGGVFTDKITWRWCFLINLPPGAITLLFLIFFFKMPGKAQVKKEMSFKERLMQFDPIGTAIFIPAIVCLLLALQWGGTQYAWKDGRIIALFILFGFLISVFIAVQVRQGDQATIPVRIFMQRSVWSGTWYALSIGVGLVIFSFYLPIYFQTVHNVSALKSGISTLPLILAVVASSILAGALVTRLGYYAPFMIVSTVVSTVGAGLISTLGVSSGANKWIPYQIIHGFGLGLGTQQPMLAVQVVLDMADVPTGLSIIMFSQSIRGALFVSVGQNVFNNKLVTGLAKYVPDLDPNVVLSAGATAVRSNVPADKLAGVLLAYSDALDSAFYVAVAMSALSIIGCLAIEWKSVKAKKVQTDTAS